VETSDQPGSILALQRIAVRQQRVVSGFEILLALLDSHRSFDDRVDIGRPLADCLRAELLIGDKHRAEEPTGDGLSARRVAAELIADGTPCICPRRACGGTPAPRFLLRSIASNRRFGTAWASCDRTIDRVSL